MPFFRVFFKTLGILFGITTFLIVINIMLFFFQNNNNFQFAEGDTNSKNLIAIINLNGPILNNFNQYLINNIIDYIQPEKVKRDLENLENLKPKIVIFKINSPGGTVSGTANLEKIIKNFKKSNEIKIYFYTNEILASGGYWVATTGDKIYAQYGAILGSIGVSGPSWYYYDQPISISTGIFGNKIETRNEIEIYDQNAGNFKDLYNPFRKPTTKELNHLKNMVGEIYNDFVLKVSQSRKIEISTLKNDIGALIFTSNQAKNNFLLDDVIEFDELINNIVKENNFKNYKIIKNNFKPNTLHKYFSNIFIKNNEKVCQKLNSNFVSLIHTFVEFC